ncbi:hypothetical protein P5V15_004253 [Pogonomyrmex californicus]
MIMSHSWIYWSFFQIQIGQALYDYCHYTEKERVRIAKRQAYAKTHEGRLCAELLLTLTKKCFLMQKSCYMVQRLPNE